MKSKIARVGLGVFLPVAILFTSNFAYSATTTGVHPVCLQKEWLDDLTSFTVAHDKSSYESYFRSRKCMMVQAGLKVTVVDSPGVFGGTTGFIANGVKGWTLREGINYRD